MRIACFQRSEDHRRVGRAFTLGCQVFPCFVHSRSCCATDCHDFECEMSRRPNRGGEWSIGTVVPIHAEGVETRCRPVGFGPLEPTATIATQGGWKIPLPGARMASSSTVGRGTMQRTTLLVVGAIGVFCLAVLTLAPARSSPLAGASAFTQATATASPVILAQKKSKKKRPVKVHR